MTVPIFRVNRSVLKEALRRSDHPFAADCITALDAMRSEPEATTQPFAPDVIENLTFRSQMHGHLHGLDALLARLHTERPARWVEVLVEREGDDFHAGRGQQVYLREGLDEVLGIWHLDSKPRLLETPRDRRSNWKRTGCLDGYEWLG